MFHFSESQVASSPRVAKKWLVCKRRQTKKKQQQRGGENFNLVLLVGMSSCFLSKTVKEQVCLLKKTKEKKTVVVKSLYSTAAVLLDTRMKYLQ